MVDNKDELFASKLKALQDAYSKELPSLLKRIQGFFGRVVTSAAKDREALSEVYRLVHSINGSGPSFGFHYLGEVAQELEILIDSVLKEPEMWSADISAKAASLLKDMLEAPLDPEEIEEPTVPMAHQETDEKDAEIGKHPFIWISDKQNDSLKTRHWLKLFGIKTIWRQRGFALSPGEEPSGLAGFIVDAGEGVNEKAFSAVIEDIQMLKSRYKRLPVFFVATKQLSLPNLIRVFEAGALVNFTLPDESFELVQRLDDMVMPESGGPYRLLIVEDDAVLATHIASIMRKAGLEVAVLNDPFGIETILDAFQPELVLMDLYLGPCSGNAVAKFIRQKAEYRNLPIVYISKETELTKRIEAFEVGADDFLMKPVKYHYLYFTLISRMKRSRLLQTNLKRDSLTGLLDHSSIRKKLAETIAESQTQNSDLTFALIDLDQIGALNAELGNEGGDRVLKTLAKLLDMNVRGKGWAGRYGGKEFSLILPGMGEDEAKAFFEPLQQGFSDMVHGKSSTSAGIQATFSCGVVTSSQAESAAKIAGLALRAMRSAQMQGGNLVVFAELVPETKPEPFPSMPSNKPPIMFDAEDDLIIFEEEDDQDSVEESVVTLEQKVKAQHQQPIDDSNHKIVLVDDEKKILSWLSAQLREFGYRVWTALSGDEGYELVVKHKPDILLTDLLLFPGIHGFELCRKVKGNPDLEKVAIAVMTAVYRDDRYRREAMDAGSKAFITKPIEIPVLLETLNALISADK